VREPLSLVGVESLAFCALSAFASRNCECSWTVTHTWGQEVAFGQKDFGTLTFPVGLDALCRHGTLVTCLDKGGKLILVISAAHKHLSIDSVVVAHSP